MRERFREGLGGPRLGCLLLDEGKRKGPEKAGASGTKNAKRPLTSGLWIEREPDPSGQKIPRVSSQANASRTGSTDSGSPAFILRHAALILDGATINPDEPSSEAIRFRRGGCPDPKREKGR
jgi:hypothetical protein